MCRCHKISSICCWCPNNLSAASTVVSQKNVGQRCANVTKELFGICVILNMCCPTFQRSTMAGLDFVVVFVDMLVLLLLVRLFQLPPLSLRG